MKLYSSLSRALEPLEPRRGGAVTLYLCGPTVYDVPHAGHARSALAPDVLVRHLRREGVAVTYVRNITDVDDKILARAKELGEPPLEFSRRMAAVYQNDIAAIGCLAPDHEPRVSDHLPQIEALIARLVERGHAYLQPMPGGTQDVYFSVRSFEGYGKLSGRRIDELRVGARVDRDETKRDPLDFALWKGAPADEWGFDSAFGRGRPGWHIECSAMSMHYLGCGFDIHAGGMDLIFPHHENEIAQSEAAYPESVPMARVWMHNGFVNMDKEKMSKSLGNFVTVRDVLARNDAEGLRWFLLGSHYRGPIQFDTEKLASGRVVFPGVDEAERRVDYVYTSLERLRALEKLEAEEPLELVPELATLAKSVAAARTSALEALNDDLNTTVALASLGEIARLGNELCDWIDKRKKDAKFCTLARATAPSVLRALDDVAERLGLLRAAPEAYRARTRARRLSLRGISETEIESQIAARRVARDEKEFARADLLRSELQALGIELHDTPTGTDWTIAP